MRKIVFMMLVLILTKAKIFGQTKMYEVHTIAFYNLENLFDTINQPNNDDGWTPEGKERWTGEKYRQKLSNMAKVIAQIGTNDEQKALPTFVGVAEVENRAVLEDLIKQPQLKSADYGIVHFDSPDKRGIDVALLYQKKVFKPISYKNIPLWIFKQSTKDKLENTNETDVETVVNKRIYTRDVLLVSGFLDDEEIHLLVNHWPSRSGGELQSRPYRVSAGRLNRKIIDSISAINPKAKIICMGDLNDGPTAKSLKEGLETVGEKSKIKVNEVYNPFEKLLQKGGATIFHRDSGDIFDQILVSETLINKEDSGWHYWKSGIFNKSFMLQNEGKYKGYPLRHSSNDVGFSDHFPVFVYLVREMK